MIPTIFGISSYYLMGMVGLIGGFILNYWETKRRGLNIRLSIDGAVWTSIMGYIGARAMHIVFDGFLEIYVQKPLAMFAFWKGGLAFYGTIIFGLPTVVLYFSMHKAPILKYLDNYAYGIAFGVGAGRMGCYLNGCCFGDITSSSFSSQFIKYGLSAKNQFARDILLNLKEMPLPVFPAQLVSFFVNMLIFLFLWLVVRKRYKKDGSVFGIWLVMYGIFRFIIEMFRADDRGLFFNDLLSSSQIIALVTIIIGALLLYLPNEQKTT